MNNPVPGTPSTVFCGIDVSAVSLAVALIEPDRPLAQRQFANSSSGHGALIVWLGKRGATVRVSLEATGIYSLDLALALHADPHIELAVLNPKLVNRFAQTLVRSRAIPQRRWFWPSTASACRLPPGWLPAAPDFSCEPFRGTSTR